MVVPNLKEHIVVTVKLLNIFVFVFFIFSLNLPGSAGASEKARLSLIKVEFFISQKEGK